MRLKQQDFITVFNGKGGEYTASIETLSRDHSSCFIHHYSDVQRELSCDVHIIQCCNRSDKIETVLQKGVELGAVSFHICNSERSALKLDGQKLEKRLQRWKKIIIEAAEQSGRTRIPTVQWYRQLDDIPELGLRLSLHPEGSQHWLQLAPDIQVAREITLAIGPEGGWSEKDLTVLESKGFISLQFGQRILRTETAAPALLAAIQSIQNLHVLN